MIQLEQYDYRIAYESLIKILENIWQNVDEYESM